MKNHSLALLLLGVSGAAYWALSPRGHDFADHGPQASTTAPSPRTKSPLVASKESSRKDTSPPVPSGLASFDPERLVAEIATSKDPQVVELTLALINAPSLEEKGRAADALAAHGGHEAIANVLRAAALQETREARSAVLAGLNNLSDAEGFSTLATGLAATRDPQFLDAIVAQLTRCGHPQVVETLVGLYRERNESPVQKSQVLRALAAFDHPELKPALQKLVTHAPEPALIQAAQVGLESIEPLSKDG